MKLSSRSGQLGAVCATIDHQAAGSADSLATVAVECNRTLAINREPLVQHVRHLEKRHIWRHVVDRVSPELTIQFWSPAATHAT